MRKIAKKWTDSVELKIKEGSPNKKHTTGNLILDRIDDHAEKIRAILESPK